MISVIARCKRCGQLVMVFPSDAATDEYCIKCKHQIEKEELKNGKTDRSGESEKEDS